MNRRVESLTRQDLERLSQQPNTVVYEPTHSMQFDPWPADKVERFVQKIVSHTRHSETDDKAKIQKELTNDTDMCEFAARYKTFFEKLTDKAFCSDEKHVEMVLSMLDIRRKVEQNGLSEQDAKVQCADAALKSLIKRTI